MPGAPQDRVTMAAASRPWAAKEDLKSQEPPKIEHYCSGASRPPTNKAKKLQGLQPEKKGHNKETILYGSETPKRE